MIEPCCVALVDHMERVRTQIMNDVTSNVQVPQEENRRGRKTETVRIIATMFRYQELFQVLRFCIRP